MEVIMRYLLLVLCLLLSATVSEAGTCANGTQCGVYRANHGRIERRTPGGWVAVARYRKIYYVYRNNRCVGITTCPNGRGRIYPTE